MGNHVIKKGLDIPIAGAPDQKILEQKPVRTVALVAADYYGLKPTFLVQPGDTVRRGQPLFEDKRFPGVMHTAPGAGTVTAIHRGERRAFQSLVIALNDRERAGTPEEADFFAYPSWSPSPAQTTDTVKIREFLLISGLWTAFRTRPFSKTPAPETSPQAIFVNAADSNPLAPDMDVVFSGRQADLDAGVLVLTRISEGKVFFCRKAGATLAPGAMEKLSVEDFSGPHPSGTAGVHIHTLAPAGRHRAVWTIGLQDVLAIGALFRTGRLEASRIIALSGPPVKRPRLLKTRLGASVDELIAGEYSDGEIRAISGSVLSGRKAMGAIAGYLGRFHNQISLLAEDRRREFLGWLAPGADKYSVVRFCLSRLFPGKKFAMTTTTHGDRRAMAPFGMYDKVMPMDILPTFLLRAILMKDTEQAEALGCLELDEEDLALCSFVSPGKEDFGPILRETLDIIEKEG